MPIDALKDFSIPFVGLKQGKTSIVFDVEDSFFKEFEGSEDFTNAKVQVELVIDKKVSFLELDFYVEGTIRATCDRCLNEMDQPILDEFKVYVKFHEDAPDMDNDDDVIYLVPGETHLEVAQLVYDFVNLSVPIQKGCPPNEVGGPQCNKEVLAYLEKQKLKDPSTDGDEDITDQRWSALKKLKK